MYVHPSCSTSNSKYKVEKEKFDNRLIVENILQISNNNTNKEVNIRLNQNENVLKHEENNFE
jgi:hypothetical protein